MGLAPRRSHHGSRPVDKGQLDRGYLPRRRPAAAIQQPLISLGAGNKKDNVTVIYTPWSNLKKDGSMEVGQVGFKDARKVKRVLVPQRENPIVNRLNKTKVEKKPDFKQEKEDRLKELRRRDQAAFQTRKKEEARQAQEWKEKKWQKDHAYDHLFTDDMMAGSSNQDRDETWEEDFM
ncbi:hypothetical protein F66182_7016 [Fusarium sp. NRRL 66182]|nr:hypothetical protein F66182_7016 [Fusarium sp. NRRL 66182]